MGHMINSAFLFDDIDNEILVCDTTSSLVVHLTGAEAAVVRDLLHSQKPIEFTGAEQAIADRLVGAGVVVEAELVDTDSSEPTSDFSRRKVLQLSAVGAAAAGLTVLALPTAAAAASGGGGSTSTTSTTVDPSTPNPQASAAGAAVLGSTIFVVWDRSGGAAFNYNWSVTGSTSGSGSAAANGLVSTALTLSPGQSATVLLTSTTTPPVSGSFTVGVPAPPT